MFSWRVIVEVTGIGRFIYGRLVFRMRGSAGWCGGAVIEPGLGACLPLLCLGWLCWCAMVRVVVDVRLLGLSYCCVCDGLNLFPPI